MNKKKVIFFGVSRSDPRREAEFFLDDEKYELAGYSDGKYDYDVLDGKTFYAPSELKNVEFDYILLLSSVEQTLMDMRQCLLAQGIPPEKILRQTITCNMDHQVDAIADIQLNYHGEKGLILGLSYSRRGIREEELNIPFYDLSWDSLDFYYCLRLLQFMDKKSLLSSVRHCLLVFPYSCFDADMSKSLHAFRCGAPMYVWQLDDWHNYQSNPDIAEYVENYRMFARKLSQFYRYSRFFVRNMITYDGEDGAAEVFKGFFWNYKETETENITILAGLLTMLRERGIQTDFVIPPYYLKGFTPESMVAIQRKKEYFYDIMAKYAGGGVLIA